MTSHDYLDDLLIRQELSTDQEAQLQRHKTELTDFLRSEFGQIPVIKYAGSHEKDTLIAEKYDLDIVCYFPSSDTRSLKDIRTDVSRHLQKNYVVQSKASAERIRNLQSGVEPNSYHIDVVPGRFIEGTSDVFLHVDGGDRERIQTNLKTHIEHVAGSGCVPIIRLAKIWACRNQVDIKTFVLELFVVRTLSGSRNKGDLPQSFWAVLEALRDEFGRVQLVDPANSANVVSQLITPSQKASVAAAASRTLATIRTADNIEGWRTVLRDTQPLPALASTSKRDPGEQFLSDLGISEQFQYQVRIDAEVTQEGFRTFLLRGSPFYLKKKKSLLFRIVKCTVPQPYSVKWKIKNRGKQAMSLDALRGQIVDDEGKEQRRETTLYTGGHYVECYVIKNGTCVAKDRIDVPISTS